MSGDEVIGLLLAGMVIGVVAGFLPFAVVLGIDQIRRAWWRRSR